MTKSGSSANKAYGIKTNFTIYGKPEPPKIDKKKEDARRTNNNNNSKEKKL